MGFLQRVGVYRIPYGVYYAQAEMYIAGERSERKMAIESVALETVVKTVADEEAEIPRRRLLTVGEYQCLGESGILLPEERLELIEGELIQKMSPQKTPHAIGIRLAEIVCNSVFMQGYDVRTQLPLTFEPHNEPEPDIAVVIGAPRDYLTGHPTTAVLILEISDTTLRYDRTVKAGLYARQGIADYWIVNLTDRILEVQRQPIPMARQPLGYGYRSTTRYVETDMISPLAAPQAIIAVADLLP